MHRNFGLNTVIPLKILTLSMHDAELDIPCLGNSVDSDQLASMKPADQDLQCFPLCMKNK